jgi:arylsulfatase
MPWAHASDTPFRAYRYFTQEGGIATPLIAHWPAGMPEAQRGTVTDAQGPIMDVMVTALDAAGTAYPEAFEGRTIAPMEGKSLLPVFETGRREGHDRIFWDHEGYRAVRDG